MKLKKLLLSVTSLTVTALLMTACAQTGTQKDTSGSSKDNVSEINLTYVESPLNVPSILQKEDNLFDNAFAEDNISVNWENITSGPDQTAALASGDLQFLHALGGTSALIAAANGVDLKIINTYSRSPKGFMILTNNSTIKSPADLKGKKIAGPKGTILHQVLLASLKNAGLSIDDVDFVNMSIPDASAALADGSIDCALLAGPTALKAMKAGSTVVANGEGLVDGIIVTAVSGEFADKHPDIVKKFMDVEKQTIDYMNNNYEEAMQKVSDSVGLTLDETKEMYSWYDFNIDITDADIQSLNDTQDFLIENGMQDNKVNVKDLIYRG